MNNYEIWMVRFTEDGQALGSHRVEIPSNDVISEADVAIDPLGKIFVVWSEYQNPGEGIRPPRARAFDPDGNAVTFGFWPTSDDAAEIRTALLPDGNFVNFWYSNNRVKAHVVSIPPPSGVVCGDGDAVFGFEECDDGEDNSDTVPDACRLNCLNPRCGDDVTDSSETCDDGNTTSCDGCSATCQAEPGGGCGDGILNSACGEQCDDGNLTMQDGCDQLCTVEPCMECSGSPSVCSVLPPADDCVQPIASGKSKLMLKEHPVTDDADKMVWTFGKGGATDMEDLGDPIGTTGYTFCIYDRDGESTSLLLGARIPAGGSCGGKPCWKMVGAAPGKGYKYNSKDMAPDGIRSVLLGTGPDGKSKVVIKGRGSRLSPPPAPFDQNPSVVAQLSNDYGTCWSDTYSAPAAKNEQLQFKDKGD
jgi:cysteine-rich repeat protein